MMKAYAEYKKSGVEWVGEIPVEWNAVPLYTVCSESKKPNKGMIEENLVSLSYGKIIRKNIQALGGMLPDSFETYQIVNKNDIIFRGMDLQNDKRSLRTAICSERGIITSAYIALIPEKIIPEFLSYIMRAYDHTKVFYNLGSGMRQSLRFEELKRLPLILPPSEQQLKIVSYLDAETVRIDNLIAEKDNFINLLQKKREVLISNVVTKGLNPSIEFKNSEIEWIGEIPKHWKTAKLKWVANTESGGTPSTQEYDRFYENGEFPWIRTTDLNNSILSTTPIKITSDALRNSSCSLINKGAVLVAMYGGAGTIGKHAFLDFKSTINQAVCAITPTDALDSKYLHLFIEFFRPFWMLFADGTRKDPNINQEVVRNMKFPLPPISEQREIVEEFLVKQEKVNNLIIETKSSIDLLKEHRTALISAAVTGKIDVREFA